MIIRRRWAEGVKKSVSATANSSPVAFFAAKLARVMSVTLCYRINEGRPPKKHAVSAIVELNFFVRPSWTRYEIIESRRASVNWSRQRSGNEASMPNQATQHPGFMPTVGVGSWVHSMPKQIKNSCSVMKVIFNCATFQALSWGT